MVYPQSGNSRLGRLAILLDLTDQDLGKIINAFAF